MVKNKKDKVEEVKPNRHERRAQVAIERKSTNQKFDMKSIIRQNYHKKKDNKRTPEQESKFRKAKNVLKRLKLASNTKGIETLAHQRKGTVLIKKYGYDKL